MSKPTPVARPSHGVHARLIDAHNPGVTMLLAIWLAAFELRRWLDHAGSLSPTGDDALRSLLYVVPIMLTGWAALTAAERWGRGTRVPPSKKF